MFSRVLNARLLLQFIAPTALKMKFSIKDFFSKCNQIRRKHLLKEFLKEKLILCTVTE